MSDHVTKIGTSSLTASEKHGLSLTESAMVHRASYSEKRLENASVGCRTMPHRACESFWGCLGYAFM